MLLMNVGMNLSDKEETDDAFELSLELWTSKKNLEQSATFYIFIKLSLYMLLLI